MMMIVVVSALRPLFQYIIERKDSTASRHFENGRKNPVQNCGNARKDQLPAETDGKNQVLEIAFMDGIEVFLAFIKHVTYFAIGSFKNPY